MGYTTIIYSEPEPHVREIRLNFPERLNAVDEVVATELSHALDETACDQDERVVVLSAEGRAFCAGANYKRHEPRRRVRDNRQRLPVHPAALQRSRHNPAAARARDWRHRRVPAATTPCRSS